MQYLSAVPWFQTAALICGLVLGALSFGYACLTIVKAQRLSGVSGLLAITGALLLVVSIWPGRSVNIDNFQAFMVDLQQQNGQLAKTLEEISGQQRTQNAALNDRNTQLKTLQSVSSQHQQQIEALNSVQAQINDGRLDSFGNIQKSLQNEHSLNLSKMEENEKLLNDISAQIKQFKADIASMSAEYVVQLETLDQQDRILAKQLNRMFDQLQTELTALQEDVKTDSQGRMISLVKSSTQHELSTLRREVRQLQTNIQHLQGRRRRTP